MKKIIFSGLILMMVVAIAACSAPSVAVVETETPTLFVLATDPPRPSDTPVPTATETATLAPSATFTATATVTLTPTPTVDLAAAKIVSMEFTGVSSMYLVFEITGIQHPYRVQMNAFSYACELLTKRPDWMICSGERISYGETVRIKYFEPESEVVAYEVLTQLPEGIPPTPLPVGDPKTWCPERGQNITCETENREYYGVPCVVSTCFDACGYYYSIHTCPEDLPWPWTPPPMF